MDAVVCAQSNRDRLVRLLHAGSNRYSFTVTNDGHAVLYSVAITDSSLVSGTVVPVVPDALFVKYCAFISRRWGRMRMSIPYTRALYRRFAPPRHRNRLASCHVFLAYFPIKPHTKHLCLFAQV